MTEKVLILGATHHDDRRAGDKRGFAIGLVPSWLAGGVPDGSLWFVVDAIGRLRLVEERDTYLWKRATGHGLLRRKTFLACRRRNRTASDARPSRDR